MASACPATGSSPSASPFSPGRAGRRKPYRRGRSKRVFRPALSHESASWNLPFTARFFPDGTMPERCPAESALPPYRICMRLLEKNSRGQEGNFCTAVCLTNGFLFAYNKNCIRRISCCTSERRGKGKRRRGASNRDPADGASRRKCAVDESPWSRRPESVWIRADVWPR